MRKRMLILLVISFLGFFHASLSDAAEEGASHAEGGHEQTIWQTIGQWTNFAALVAILYFFIAKKLRVQDKFKAEAEEIQRSVETARAAKNEAERQMEAMDQRMQLMNEEVSRIRERAMQDAEDEKRRILESAQKEAQRIVDIAHREIDNEVRVAKKQLRKQVADLAVQQGQRIIEQEITEEDQQRLIKAYIEEFGK